MSYHSDFLKWKMEMVWKHKGCVSPNHLARWSDFERGYQCWVNTPSRGWLVVLWYQHGKRMTSTKGCKPRGKGFSFHPMTAYRKWLES